jgi:hypothetical protein
MTWKALARWTSSRVKRRQPILKLRKTHDLAAQLSNAEWIDSVPGTVAEKAILRPCSHCHTLERILRSRHNVDQMVAVIERMATYPQLSFPQKIQKLPAPRVGPGPVSQEEREATWRPSGGISGDD